MTSIPTAPADVDVRAFVFQLEPLEKKILWSIETETRTMAMLARRREDIERQMAVMRGQIQASQEVLRSREPDPALHGVQLRDLVHAKRRLADTSRALESIERECEEARQRLLGLQVRMEALARHRQAELANFAQDVRRRDTTERDRDWLARTPPPSLSEHGREGQPW